MTSKLRRRGTGEVIRRSRSELMSLEQWKAAKAAKQPRGKPAPVKYGSAITPENPRQKTQQQRKMNENG